MTRYIFALLAIILSGGNCEIVETTYGPIRGIIETSILGKAYFSFRKIPYMRPPIGNLAFKDPEPATPWTEPLDCTVQGPRFPQIDLTYQDYETPFEGDLDSMHINVYTKKLKPAIQNEPLPVLVFIHGGGMHGFTVGSTAIYGPDYFMEKDVVLVTFNYRLHAYGFLSLNDESLGVPGNAGLKDQRMALKWVKDNIENFGGNSENITVFGHSSGGGSIHYHLISDGSKDLFQRSIIMSGSAINNMHGIVPRKNWALRLAQKLNFNDSENEEDILRFFESADPREIFSASRALLTIEEKESGHIFEAFGPTIEPYANNNSFLLDHPENLMDKSWGNKINVFLGASAFEKGHLVSLYRDYPFIIEEQSNFKIFLPKRDDERFSTEELIEHSEKLKKTYYGMMEPSITNIDGLIYVNNEMTFWHPIHRIVKERISSNENGKTFLYKFDTASPNNCFSELKNMSELYTRPIHMDELCYLFKTTFSVIPDVDHATIDKMTDLFVNFAKTGEPGYEGWNEAMRERKTLWGCKIQEKGYDCDEFPEAKRMEIWDTISSSIMTKPTIFLIIFIMFKNLFM